ncbi:MAG: ATP-binding protein, partial [Spirochaetaceae bacterium]|nr:ATP-binding protein [Spirochaetaceae bacterium]
LRELQEQHAREWAATNSQLEARNLEIERANRLKSEFLASMSHEFRTPLNAILGFSRLLQSDPEVPDTQKNTLGIITRSGEHLLTWINSVLDMAKIEAGHAVLEISAFDISAMMRDIVDLMLQQATAKKLTLTAEMIAGTPRAVKTDEGKLRQIILNLVGNALKFSTIGGVTLRLSARTSDESPGTLLVVEVVDEGDGIAAADQRRIFDPFIQVGHGSAQKGSGLGLTITRQFVELMGGTIRVESEPGKGSRFTVEIPVEPAAISAIVVAEAEKNRVRILAPGQRDYRILIVEDQEENYQLLREILERAGFLVRVAEDGEKGIDEFRSWQPDFIWMDWRMPVLDGLEATRRIRILEGGRRAKIAVLSASAFDEERDQIFAAGADDFVPKPFLFSQIYDCMARNLGLRFIVDEQISPIDMSSSVQLNLEAIAALPEPIRAELAGALIDLDCARISSSIGRVTAIDKALGDDLKVRAGTYQYTAILRALRPGTVAIEEGGAP